MTAAKPRVSGDLVRLIRTSGSASKILRAHEADTYGRCPLCRGGGTASGHVLAPCVLFVAATAAKRLDDA